MRPFRLGRRAVVLRRERGAGTAVRVRAVSVLGIEVDGLTEPEVVAKVLNGVGDERGGWVASVNADILRQVSRSRDLALLLSGAAVRIPDGLPIVWASRLLGSRLPQRVTGSDLIWSLPAAAADAGASVALIGGNPGAAEGAARVLEARFPRLGAVQTYCPPLGFEEDPTEGQRIREFLEKFEPDIVFIGLGFPKQEVLIAELSKRFKSTWFVACGIALSFVSGEFSRAPAVLGNLGLEWLYRLGQDPRRLFRRYIIHDLPFLVRLFARLAWRRLSEIAGRSVSPNILG